MVTMDNPAAKKAAKKRRLREKRAAAHIPTPADDTATLNSIAIDPSAAKSTNTDHFGHSVSTATLNTSENVTPTPSLPPVTPWDSLSDTCQEAGNYYLKQQPRTAPIAVYVIVEPPTTSARDDGDTVEQVDARLLRMEQYWAESRSSPFPKSIRSAVADLRLAVERRETEAAWNAAVQVCAVQAAEMEEENEEESEEESTEGEEDERQQRGEKERKGIEKEVEARERETERQEKLDTGK